MQHRAITAFFCLLLLCSSAALAGSYKISNLVSNKMGKATHTDALLKNPWGLAYAPGQPFWISDNASGRSTLYTGSGGPQSLKVKIPSASGSGSGTPTGIVYNGSQEFKIETWTSLFLFATLDGTISGWSAFEPNTALIGVTQEGASYTGLAITTNASNNRLFAADAANNKVDIYDGNFNLVTSVTDSNTNGFAPFGIQDIGGQVYVAYASTDGGPGGYIDILAEDGTFVKRLAQGDPLNQAWGLAVAPAGFGPLSGTLLVANNTSDGTINGFNLETGEFVGAVTNSAGKAITSSGLWGIEFGGGTTSNGKMNQLFFTAGPNDVDGVFGAIEFSPTIDLSASPKKGGMVSGGGTVPEGGSHTVKATAMSGYAFINWTEGTNVVSTSASYTHTVTTDEVLVANFTQKFTLKLIASPPAGGQVSGGGTYIAGSGVVATATPRKGYVFNDWTQGTNVVSSAASDAFTLSTNTTLTAHFSKVPIPKAP
jgi:uncharacterized protein (TIGR03118 family)